MEFALLHRVSSTRRPGNGSILRCGLCIMGEMGYSDDRDD